MSDLVSYIMSIGVGVLIKLMFKRARTWPKGGLKVN